MKKELPQSVKACLWSYDTSIFDLLNLDHRSIIIHNILNYGSTEAIFWLMDTFTKQEIEENIKNSASSDWNKKSLSLWSLIFKTQPTRQGRFA